MTIWRRLAAIALALPGVWPASAHEPPNCLQYLNIETAHGRPDTSDVLAQLARLPEDGGMVDGLWSKMISAWNRVDYYLEREIDEDETLIGQRVRHERQTEAMEASRAAHDRWVVFAEENGIAREVALFVTGYAANYRRGAENRTHHFGTPPLLYFVVAAHERQTQCPPLPPPVATTGE